MKFWFAKFPVERVVIIDITEEPKYRQPKDVTVDQLSELLDKLDDNELEISSGVGLVKRGNPQWVGALTFSLEIWE